MEFLLILFTPTLLTWALLASMPNGVPFLATFACVIVFLVVWAGQTIQPANGPNDWLHGIDRARALMALTAAVSVLPAQLVRWWKDLGVLQYLLILAVSTTLVCKKAKVGLICFRSVFKSHLGGTASVLICCLETCIGVTS